MQCTSRAGRRLFGRALVWGLLCALALVLQQAARPESAQAAKVTKGWLTGKILFNKHETRGIAEGGGGAVALCGRFVPPPFDIACLAAVAWTVQAVRARNRGKCLQVKFVHVLPGYPSLPGIYSGGYCR